MTTSEYMPDVKVEIAFNAGVNTPAADRVWTDVSEWVELADGLTISVGRQDERSTADANHLSLTLDNSDGRFTAGRALSPYYPNVRLNRPIRVSALPVDGIDWQVRFLGFIDEWPTEWNGTDAYAWATVSASSRLSRLGLQANLKSIVEIAVLADSPTAYYTLAEPDGSTQANDSSGARAPALVLGGDLTLPLQFGQDLGRTSGVKVNNGQFLYRNSPIAPPFTVEFLFRRDSLPAAAGEGMWFTRTYQTSIVMGTDGRVTGGFPPSGNVVSAESCADGEIHHVALTVVSGGTAELFIDGMSQGTASGSPAGSGGADLALGASSSLATAFGGHVAHYAEWDSVLTSDQIASHAAAGTTGYAGETTAERLVRYAGYAGVPAAEVDAETGSTTVQHVDTTEKQVVELMRLMEATEGGVLFDAPAGALVMHDRGHRLTTTYAYTLDFAQHHVESGYAPKLDRSTLVNDVTGVDTSGRFTAHVFDLDSQEAHGVATLSVETASEDDDEPLFIASWALFRYQEPLPRVAALSVDVLAQVGTSPGCATIMATTVGTRVKVTNRPVQDADVVGSYFVEGWTESYGPESLVFSLQRLAHRRRGRDVHPRPPDSRGPRRQPAPAVKEAL